MRVLHLIPSMAGGGAERQIAYLAQGLSDLSCEVHVGILRGGVNLERLESTGATVHRIPAGGNYDPLLLPRIVGLIRRVRPDVVQTWLTQMDVAGGLAALITGRRWIISERSSGAHYPKDARHLMRRAVGQFATAIVANSQGGLSFWKSSSAPKFVVPNAVPLEEIAACSREEPEVGDARVILYAGRLSDEKNLFHLIDALDAATRERDAVALLCGVGPLEAAVLARIEARGARERIRLRGFTDRIWGLMKRADLLVAVSWFEGHPNVVLEAAAAGCPLVLSEIDAHRAVLDDDSALFVLPGDVEGISAAIGVVLDDPASAAERASRARDRLAAFSIAAAAGNYLRVYGSC